jgi:hypothetical protein
MKSFWRSIACTIYRLNSGKQRGERVVFFATGFAVDMDFPAVRSGEIALDKDGLHPRGMGALYSHFTILEHEAFFRGHAEQPGRVQKHIRCRFSVFHVLKINQVLKVVPDTDPFQAEVNDLFQAAGDDGDRVRLGDEFEKGDNRGDGFDLVHVCAKKRAFDFHEGFSIELHTESFIQDAHQLVGFNPGELVIHILWKMKGLAVFLDGVDPALVVDGHGVNEGAVTVEKVGFKGAFRNIEHVPRLFSHVDDVRYNPRFY